MGQAGDHRITELTDASIDTRARLTPEKSWVLCAKGLDRLPLTFHMNDTMGNCFELHPGSPLPTGQNPSAFRLAYKPFMALPLANCVCD